MQVTLIDHTNNPEVTISKCAAICYDSDTSEEACNKRIKKLMNVKHLATLRFAYATFHIQGVSRACSHQLVRHPHLSYLQRSQRYCNESKQEFTLPEGIEGDVLVDWINAREACETAYNSAITAGVLKGDARYILPQSVHTEMYVTGNFQAWFDFLKNRLDKAAQWEIREVANKVKEQLVLIAPNVFSDFS